MTYKVLAVDVDGTLLRKDGSIHPEDRASIGRLMASGVPVTIVTGRLYSGTRSIASSLGLEGPIACVDGSHIVDLRDDRPLYYSALTGSQAVVLRNVLVRHETVSFLFAQDSIVHDATAQAYAGYVATWSPKITMVDRVHDHPYWEHELGIMAVVALGTELAIRAAEASLVAHGDPAIRTMTFPIATNGQFAILVRAANASKGTAVEWLARHHGCTPREVVVVGDWLNDLPMFEVAGRSFAMSQAPKVLKSVATDLLAANGIEGGGIAEAIRRVWGL